MLHFFEPNNISLQISDFEIISESASQRSKSIKLLNHKLLGKILVINGEIQHIEAWAPLYHESLVHIPASFIPKVKTVLIIGGGSFFAANEIFKYKSIEKVVMVDYDNAVISLISANYSHPKQILTDERFSLVIEDVKSFLKKSNERFDLIINDALDLLEAPVNSFELLASKLSDHGICCDLVYRHIYESDRSNRTVSLLRKKFHTAFSLVTVPEYPGIMHLLSMWSKSPALKQSADKVKNEIQKKWAKYPAQSKCVSYDPRFLRYYLYLPPYLKTYIKNI